jgi:hypothetical protein
MKEDEILEFSFRSIRKKKPVRRSSPGCPVCGETAVSNGKTYDCGYSSSANGVTPCMNADEFTFKADIDGSFIAELKDNFNKKKSQNG